MGLHFLGGNYAYEEEEEVENAAKVSHMEIQRERWNAVKFQCFTVLLDHDCAATTVQRGLALEGPLNVSRGLCSSVEGHMRL